jgi:hypothetical protein
VAHSRYGPKGKVRSKFSLQEWAKRPEIADAWKEIAVKNDLVIKELTDVDRIFGFGNRFCVRSEPLVMR